MASAPDPSSSGHKLGQLIGDWWELHVVYPVLSEVAGKLGLFLDNRCVSRDCRAEKIEWTDVDGNIVDYDFVLEFGGTPQKRGVPVAFIESFWRRGSRHSKDKARDDTNKLLPMRDTYPTARLLAIAACGEFTNPAREYVRTRQVELLLVSKGQIVDAFASQGINIDYPDKLGEPDKLKIANAVESQLDSTKRQAVAKALRKGSGALMFSSFVNRMIGALTAQPQEIRFVQCDQSHPIRFTSLEDAEQFLENPVFDAGGGGTSYRYEVTYSDGSEFLRNAATLDELRELHHSLAAFVRHVSAIAIAKA